jgi:hypothetical protein
MQAGLSGVVGELPLRLMYSMAVTRYVVPSVPFPMWAGIDGPRAPHRGGMAVATNSAPPYPQICERRL